jgi:transcriptional regulator with XRE-family HTH domain
MNQPELGKKIAELRKVKGLTQEELVEKCNISVRTLQRIESGEVTPRSYTVKIIFAALDYTDSLKISKTAFSISGWLEQFYRYVLDLFNLKTNTMKKISLLSVIVILGVSLAFNIKVNSQTNRNPLLGSWKLVCYMDVITDNPLFNGKQIKVLNPTTRFMEFREDFKFRSLNSDSSIYNSGIYNLVNDSLFVTIHSDFSGLSRVSNLYKFEIKNDTLHFKGYYLSKIKDFGDSVFKTGLIDEWWIKLKDKE